ncbi:hypothetical protein GF327_03605 [Candidatus Woesearchaeota archaeon]|nr:hypothetical protein [Candidatus Woesearchaeota archaeon]
MLKSKKSIMAFSVVFIFLLSIFFSLGIATTILNTQFKLSSKSKEVGNTAGDRIVNRIVTRTIKTISKPGIDKFYVLDFLITISDESDEIDIRNLDVLFSSSEGDLGLDLFNASDPSLCRYYSADVSENEEFCYKVAIGDNDLYLEHEEFFRIIFMLNESHALRTDEAFEVNFLPRYGSLSHFELRTPTAASKIEQEIYCDFC